MKIRISIIVAVAVLLGGPCFRINKVFAVSGINTPFYAWPRELTNSCIDEIGYMTCLEAAEAVFCEEWALAETDAVAPEIDSCAKSEAEYQCDQGNSYIDDCIEVECESSPGVEECAYNGCYMTPGVDICASESCAGSGYPDDEGCLDEAEDECMSMCQWGEIGEERDICIDQCKDEDQDIRDLCYDQCLELMYDEEWGNCYSERWSEFYSECLESNYFYETGPDPADFDCWDTKECEFDDNLNIGRMIYEQTFVWSDNLSDNIKVGEACSPDDDDLSVMLEKTYYGIHSELDLEMDIEFYPAIYRIDLPDIKHFICSSGLKMMRPADTKEFKYEQGRGYLGYEDGGFKEIVEYRWLADESSSPTSTGFILGKLELCSDDESSKCSNITYGILSQSKWPAKLIPVNPEGIADRWRVLAGLMTAGEFNDKYNCDSDGENCKGLKYIKYVWVEEVPKLDIAGGERIDYLEDLEAEAEKGGWSVRFEGDVVLNKDVEMSAPVIFGGEEQNDSYKGGYKFSKKLNISGVADSEIEIKVNGSAPKECGAWICNKTKPKLEESLLLEISNVRFKDGGLFVASSGNPVIIRDCAFTSRTKVFEPGYKWIVTGNIFVPLSGEPLIVLGSDELYKELTEIDKLHIKKMGYANNIVAGNVFYPNGEDAPVIKVLPGSEGDVVRNNAYLNSSDNETVELQGVIESYLSPPEHIKLFGSDGGAYDMQLLNDPQMAKQGGMGVDTEWGVSKVRFKVDGRTDKISVYRRFPNGKVEHQFDICHGYFNGGLDGCEAPFYFISPNTKYYEKNHTASDDKVEMVEIDAFLDAMVSPSLVAPDCEKVWHDYKSKKQFEKKWTTELETEFKANIFADSKCTGVATEKTTKCYKECTPPEDAVSYEIFLQAEDVRSPKEAFHDYYYELQNYLMEDLLFSSPSAFIKVEIVSEDTSLFNEEVMPYDYKVSIEKKTAPLVAALKEEGLLEMIDKHCSEYVCDGKPDDAFTGDCTGDCPVNTCYSSCLASKGCDLIPKAKAKEAKICQEKKGFENVSSSWGMNVMTSYHDCLKELFPEDNTAEKNCYFFNDKAPCYKIYFKPDDVILMCTYINACHAWDLLMTEGYECEEYDGAGKCTENGKRRIIRTKPIYKSTDNVKRHLPKEEDKALVYDSEKMCRNLKSETDFYKYLLPINNKVIDPETGIVTGEKYYSEEDSNEGGPNFLENLGCKSDEECEAGFFCDLEQKGVNQCKPVLCGEGMKLVGSECKPIVCSYGYELVDSDCVKLECADDEKIIDGECKKIDCPDGYHLEDKVCKKDETAGIKCEEELLLVGDECLPECPEWMVKVDDICLDPNTACGEGEQFLDGACVKIEEEKKGGGSGCSVAVGADSAGNIIIYLLLSLVPLFAQRGQVFTFHFLKQKGRGPKK